MQFYGQSRSRWAATVMAVTTAAWLGTGERPQAAKSVTTNGRVIFTSPAANTPGFYGDGLGPYEGGLQQIQSGFNVSGSGDFTLNLINSTRRFSGTYAPVSCLPATGACPEPNPATGNYIFTDGWFINVHQIANMHQMESRWTQASFTAAFGAKLTRSGGYLSQWNFLWCGDGSVALPNWCNGLQANGSQLVLVTRNADTADPSGNPNWSVSSASTPTAEMKELEYAQPNNNPTVTLHGTYAASVQLAIVCTSGCSVFPQ